MSILGKPPRDLLITDNPKDFEQWITTFKHYLTVVEIGTTLNSQQKHALLLNCIGEEAIKIISGLSYETVKDPYNSLVSALRDYFIPKANLTFERFHFRKLVQEDKLLPFLNELHRVGKNVISITTLLIRYIIRILGINSFLDYPPINFRSVF